MRPKTAQELADDLGLDIVPTVSGAVLVFPKGTKLTRVEGDIRSWLEGYRAAMKGEVERA